MHLTDILRSFRAFWRLPLLIVMLCCTLAFITVLLTCLLETSAVKSCVAEGRLLTQAGAVLLLQKLLLESKQGISFRNKKGARPFLSASM